MKAKNKQLRKPAQLAQRITITLRGNNDGDLESALDEVLRLLREGYQSGHNSNESGAFYFTTTDDVPTGEEPA